MKPDVNPSSSYHAVSLILTMPGKEKTGERRDIIFNTGPVARSILFPTEHPRVSPCIHPSYSTNRQPGLYDIRYSANFQQFKEGKRVCLFSIIHVHKRKHQSSVIAMLCFHHEVI